MESRVKVKRWSAYQGCRVGRRKPNTGGKAEGRGVAVSLWLSPRSQSPAPGSRSPSLAGVAMDTVSPVSLRGWDKRDGDPIMCYREGRIWLQKLIRQTLTGLLPARHCSPCWNPATSETKGLP